MEDEKHQMHVYVLDNKCFVNFSHRTFILMNMVKTFCMLVDTTGQFGL